MGQIRHSNHGQNMTEKAIRFSDALKVNDAAGVPAALAELEQTSELGIRLAELAWLEIAKGMPARESVNGPVPEDPPGEDTRAVIIALCRYPAVLSWTPENTDLGVEDPFAGITE